MRTGNCGKFLQVLAWISAPQLDTSKLACDAAGDCAGFDLSLIDSIGISLVDSGSTDTTFWLFASPDSRTREAALFSEMNVGDLRSYMGDTVYMELEIKIDPNEYHFLRYWRDYCGMSDDCQLAFPLSMQFKMEDGCRGRLGWREGIWPKRDGERCIL